MAVAPNHPPAIFLMGPTAAGKSALAVRLAQALDTEIISVDSALVFKGLDIGTAKPTLAERGGIPHHLIDILDPAASFSTGQFRTQALALMADLARRGKIPVLVGGTMLYFNALLNGIAELPNADPALRARLDDELARLGSAALHRRLAAVDPKAAARIHPNDPQRIQRALEVHALTGRPLTDHFGGQHRPLPYQVSAFILAPAQRSILHERIARRFQAMLAQGFVAEVERLHRRGDLSPALPALRTVGYRQAWAYLEGEDDLPTMTAKAIAATRQLAKRQFTWLRKQTQAVPLDSGSPGLLASIMAVLARNGA